MSSYKITIIKDISEIVDKPNEKVILSFIDNFYRLYNAATPKTVRTEPQQQQQKKEQPKQSKQQDVNCSSCQVKFEISDARFCINCGALNVHRTV